MQSSLVASNPHLPIHLGSMADRMWERGGGGGGVDPLSKYVYNHAFEGNHREPWQISPNRI